MTYFRQRLMANIANRSFKRKPNILDRLAIKFLATVMGPIQDDPELEHPE